MATHTVNQHTTYNGSSLPYEGIDSFTGRLSVDRSALESGDRRTPQYTTFRNVSPEEFEQKIAPKTTSASAFARFRYNTITKDLITKVPGEGHGILNFTFQMLVLTRFMEMGISVGDFTCMASPMARLGPWLRQPDSCWAPPGHHEPLSVVLELGVTGAEPGLLADVHEWLETPGSPVSMVITICISSLSRRTMTIETWVATHNNRDDNSKVTSSAVRSSIITIQNKTLTGVATNPQSGATQPCDELRIPFETILRRTPEGQERDVVLDKDELLKLADTIWRAIMWAKKPQ